MDGFPWGRVAGGASRYARIVDELLSQGVVRSTNNPVADCSEYLTARAFGLTLVASSSIGYDAIGEDDVRYQVKARRLTAETRPVNSG